MQKRTKRKSRARLELLEPRFLLASVDSLSVATPANLQASDLTIYGAIQLAWDPVPEATSYKVWRSETDAFAQADDIPEYVTAPDFRDTDVYPDIIYHYWVQAQFNGVFSDISSADTGVTTRPLAPTSLTASDATTTDAVHLNWQPSTGAAIYYIERFYSADSSYPDRIGSTSETQFDDETATFVGHEYQYTATAAAVIDDYDRRFRSDPSIPDSGSLRPLDIPQNVVAADGVDNDVITVTWDACEGATSYKIWRAQINYYGTTEFQHIATVHSTSYDDGSVGMLPYLYKVVAHNSHGDSQPSATDEGTLRDSQRPTFYVFNPGRYRQIPRGSLNARRFIDVDLWDYNSGVDWASLADAAPEFTLGGVAATGVTVNPVPKLLKNGNARYSFTGRFGIGIVTVTVLDGAITDKAGNGNVGYADPFTVLTRPPGYKDVNDQLAEAKDLGELRWNDQQIWPGHGQDIVRDGLQTGRDVNMYRFHVQAGQELSIRYNEPRVVSSGGGSGSTGGGAIFTAAWERGNSGPQAITTTAVLNPKKPRLHLRIFNDQGQELLFPSADGYLRGHFEQAGDYYVGISLETNVSYDPIFGEGDVYKSRKKFRESEYDFALSDPILRTTATRESDGASTPLVLRRYADSTNPLAPIDIRRGTYTWLVIHGRGESADDPQIQELARTLAASSTNQIVTLDWSNAALPADSLDFSGEDWIEAVANAARQLLQTTGLWGHLVSHAGQGWGAYVAAEIAEMNGSHAPAIVALDPPRDVDVNESIGGVTLRGGAYDPDAPDQINFSRDSNSSLAISTFVADPVNVSSVTAATAHHTLVLRDPQSADGAINHFAAAPMLTRLLAASPGDALAPLKDLFVGERLNIASTVPWLADQYDLAARTDSDLPRVAEAVVDIASDDDRPIAIEYVNLDGQPVRVPPLP